MTQESRQVHIKYLEVTMNTEPKKTYLLPCPDCMEKTDVKIYKDTSLFNFPLYCPHGKKEILVNVFQLKIVKSDSSD